jgi:hypothetical protein
MEVLSMKTPVETCLARAGYTLRMMAKHPEYPVLGELAPRLAAGRSELAQAERAVGDAEGVLLLARVDVKFEDHASDEWLRGLQSQAQIADRHKGGRVSTTLFPDGMTEIARRQGPPQVKRMRELEGRLEHMTDWPEAPAQHAALVARRTSYELALDARTEAERGVTRARSARDAAKVRFLDLYAEIAGRIQAAFPRNRRMQELFFDVPRPRPRPGADEPEETLPGEPAGDAGTV